MLVLTLMDSSRPVLIAKNHIVMVEEGKPKGTVITLIRGTVHVAQTLSHVQAHLGKDN